MNSDDLQIRSSKLTLEHLKQHAAWGSFEEDDSEMIRPVNSMKPFSVDCDPLTLKADFITSGGKSLSGCVVVDRSIDKVYLVEIFVDDKYYGFNVALTDIAQSQLEKLRQNLGNLNEPVFPLVFTTAVEGPDGRVFSGVFSPFK